MKMMSGYFIVHPFGNAHSASNGASIFNISANKINKFIFFHRHILKIRCFGYNMILVY